MIRIIQSYNFLVRWCHFTHCASNYMNYDARLYRFLFDNFRIWQHGSAAAPLCLPSPNVRPSCFNNHLRLFLIKIIQFGHWSCYVVSFYATYVQEYQIWSLFITFPVRQKLARWQLSFTTWPLPRVVQTKMVQTMVLRMIILIIIFRSNFF